MKYLGLALLTLAFAACTNNNTNAGQDMTAGNNDMQASSGDMTTPPPAGDMSTADLYYPGPATDGGPLMCGNMTCNPGEVCCVTVGAGGSGSATCATSCADGGVAIACTGPGDCGGDPCCLTVQNKMFEGAMCTTSMDACQPNFNISGSGMTRACNVDGDCTAGLAKPPGGMYMYPDCCHYTGNTTVHFCFSKNLVALTQGAITCP